MSFLPRRKDTASRRNADEFMKHVADVCERAASGDLEARVVGVPPTGEVHRIGTAINSLLDIADAYVRESAAAMDHCSHSMFHRPILTRGLAGSYRDSAVVINQAAHKMKLDAANLTQFETERARVANDIANATNAVAAACEELNATTSVIKGQLGAAVDMTHCAVADSNRSVEAIQQLGEAARRIESVVALIARIARHTNLLALNATIEAARAGVHGAGFAVVANEVKVLSQDTAKATQDIVKTVEEMLAATEHASNAIASIGTSIKDVDTNATNILVSLDEQVKATGEIADRIGEVASQTRDMTTSNRGEAH
jgi:methyl-accepting chemotaxis protein